MKLCEGMEHVESVEVHDGRVDAQLRPAMQEKSLIFDSFRKYHKFPFENVRYGVLAVVVIVNGYLHL